MADSVVKYGKVVYVEPNNFLENSLYQKNNNGSYNITHPYEDYSLSVDLVVRVPSRYGAKNESGTVTAEMSGSDGNVSFFCGTDGYMTDNVTTITYKDILNNESSKESLGITNIHISYNSYFYPEVTINFTDVRGSSLMMPNEENYMREQRNMNDRVKNFFSALFSFPYPEFKLQVKGFYGKKVEYSLLVVDFRSSFNNSTGNFDATVKFIGKMFGLYTDIPMTYLLLAPYCKYGGQNGLTIWQQKKFKFDNGVEIPTFVQLKKDLLTLNKNLDKYLDSDMTNKFRKAGKKVNLLQEIRSEYTNLLKEISNHEGTSVNNDAIIYKAISSKSTLASDTEGYNCDYFYSSNIISEITSKLYQLISDYKESFGGESIPFLLSKKESKLDESDILQIVIHQNGTQEYFMDNKVIGDDNDFVKTFKPYLLKQTENCNFYVKDCKNFIKEVNTQIDSAKKELNKVKEDTNNNSTLVISKILGFSPTIKNVFKILMAHMETFMEIMNTFNNNVTGVQARKLSEYGLSLTDVTDLKDGAMPAFPGFKNEHNEFCYPNIYLLAKQLEEDVLIESLLDGVKVSTDELGYLSSLEDEVNDESINLIPTCLTDLYNVSNPYETVFENGDNVNGIEWIFTYFGIRCISKLMYEGVSDSIQNNLNLISSETFGKCEAYNFWRVNRNLNKNILNALGNENCNHINFINFLAGISKDNPYIINNNPCYKTNEKTSALLTLDGNGMLSSTGNFNVPAMIGRDNGNINTYYADMDNENYSYPNGKLNGQPLKFINFINHGTITEWNKQLNALNSDDFCDEIAKHQIIGRFVNSYNRYKFDSNAVTFRKEKSTSLDKNSFVVFHTNYDTINTVNYGNEIGNEIDGVHRMIYGYSNANVAGLTETPVHTLKHYSSPLFFDEKVTAESFLCSLIDNLDVGSEIFNGNTIVNINKITLLFIGMVLEQIHTTDPKDNTPNIQNFIYRHKSSSFEGKSIRFYENLAKLIICLTRSKDNKYCEDIIKPMKGSSDPSFNYISFIDYINRNKEYFTNDFLHLKEKYNEWKDDKKEGFAYLKNEYCLFENAKTDKDVHNICYENSCLNFYIYFDGKNKDKYTKKLIIPLKHSGELIDTIEVKGVSLSSRFSDFCSKFYELTSKEKNNGYLKIEQLYDIINIMYKKNVDTDTETTDFSDRYLCVHHYGDGEGFRNSVYFSLNPDFPAYKTLNKLLTEESLKLLVPYSFNRVNKDIFNSENKPTIGSQIFRKAFDSFKNNLLILYGIKTVEGENNSNKTGDPQLKTEDNKYALYRTLKNLFDKHLHDLPTMIDKFRMSEGNSNEKVETEFDRFHFVDSFFNDMSNELLFNLDIVNNVIRSVTDGYNNNDEISYSGSEMSVYSFMSLLCQRHNTTLMCMPIFNGSFTKKGGEKNLVDMFTPYTYNETVNDNTLSGPSYVCIYTHQPSQHLDIPDSTYPNDSFNLIDINGTNNFTGPVDIPDLNEENSDYIIPAFGVEYGSQKQSIFKSINVNMDNPQTTEVAVSNLFNLINTDNEDMKKMRLNGQDLYKIYSNYSYTCQVEMMGCSQIQPLMFFQLNNIPMFRGSYMIINVEHDITPGNMITSFKGVRMNRTKIPMVKSCISAIDMERLMNTEESAIKPGDYDVNIRIIQASALIDDKIKSISETAVTSQSLIDEFGDQISFRSEDKKDRFNELNPMLRNLVYCILYDFKKDYEKNPSKEKIGMVISSASRHDEVGGNSKSDHFIGGSPSYARTILSGQTFTQIEKTYKEMGCAIDFHGKYGKNETIDAEASVFYHIARNYADYCRQLIWECGINNKDTVVCLHLASYGKYDEVCKIVKEHDKNKTDKSEMYVATNNYKGVVETIRNTDDMPKAFKKVLSMLLPQNNGGKSVLAGHGGKLSVINYSGGKVPTNIS